MSSTVRHGPAAAAALASVLAVSGPALGTCPWDCGNSDGRVGIMDLIALLRQFGGPGTCDFDDDGVNAADLAELLVRWGVCPVSAGACCLADGCVEAGEEECQSLGGGGWVAEASCADADGDRLADAFELNDCAVSSGCLAGTDPHDPDTDGDGITDGDEVLLTEGGLDLAALGADPLRKDIFLETDWMDDPINGAHSHRPWPASAEALVAVFDDSPVGNPCGGPGIALHVDYGQGGLFSGGALIGTDTVVMYDTEYNAYKAQHFDPARQGYFHYSIHCHRYNSPDNPSTGVAEFLGDDFLVSLGNYLNASSIAKIIMHELGHNLGLRHGGFENRNYKPNYNSVMNYRFTFAGIDMTCDSIGDGVLDYSSGRHTPLDETALLEWQGVCGGDPIDWNGDAHIDLDPYAFNVNCTPNSGEPCGAGGPACHDSTCDLLLDHADWGAITLRIPPWTDFAAEIVTCIDVPGGGGDGGGDDDGT